MFQLIFVVLFVKHFIILIQMVLLLNDVKLRLMY